MRIKVEPYTHKKGNKVGKAVVEFDSNDGFMDGLNLIGFTICENEKDELYVLNPSCEKTNTEDYNKFFFFLRPNKDGALEKLEEAILDVYDKMIDVYSVKD